MYRQVRMMAVGNPNNPIVPGTILVTDTNSARTMGNYFQVEVTGTTAQRPKAGDADYPVLSAGTAYIDTTLSKVIYYDGTNWRDPFTGAAV